MEQMVLKADRRTTVGTKDAKKVRAQGRLPVVIYGHGEPPEPITVDAHDLLLELKHGARVLSVDVGGQTGQFLIKDVQYDYLGTNPIHVDLMRVNLSELVRVTVAIELRGIPAGVAEGGVLEHPTTEVEVECVVMQIPDSVPVSVKHLQVGEAILAKELPLPEGVALVTDPDERIATVRALAEEVVAEETTEEDAQQPEVIGRPQADESAAGES